jgi:hypothetical protein
MSIVNTNIAAIGRGIKICEQTLEITETYTRYTFYKVRTNHFMNFDETWLERSVLKDPCRFVIL